MSVATEWTGPKGSTLLEMDRELEAYLIELRDNPPPLEAGPQARREWIRRGQRMYDLSVWLACHRREPPTVETDS